ncbi:Interferon-stimulated 20 kDa exonuclease-like 2 [Triplophysa tibetana]|uniref:Interferon-stimulated 20 kDa exonuclease-like 2 n=1 Tax=Triplophysa tibetana TaxID=1572043 RepID=A0A5A9N2W8_9TELE|nr:Interferon-stimulated 20 kDa exonuclease-like 2 [Triplophysa tibetana]
MSGISLNLNFDPTTNSGKKRKSKAKYKFSHKWKRPMDKSSSFTQNKNNCNGNERMQNKVLLNGERQSNPGAVFPKFYSTQPDKTNTPSSSAQVLCQKSSTSVSSTACTSQGKPAPRLVPTTIGPLKYIALDCEMVGTGPKGSIGELGRCSIVSYDGDVIYDKFIQPTKPVTDFRTRWSGIRRQDLRYATPFRQAQAEIVKIMTGKVVVGHAIHNDFKALKYFHPAGQTRDTARIPLLNQKAGFPEHETASLKRLTMALFNKSIQVGRGGHSSVEDAKATMELYKLVEEEWERTLASPAVS